MGLAIRLGVLVRGPHADLEGIEWSRKDFREVNRVLKANKLPAHVEPEALAREPRRHGWTSFPYASLHYLRRAVAFARQAPTEFCPIEDGISPADDERIDQELCVFMDSHMICHSHCSGYYVPIDFPEPLHDDEDRLAGGILGSSQRALAEVIQAAPLLGITLQAGRLSDRAARAIAKEEHGVNPYWIERQVWLTMYEAFRASVESGCAVVFG